MKLAEIEIRAALEAVAMQTFGNYTLEQVERLMAAIGELREGPALGLVTSNFLIAQMRGIVDTKKLLNSAARIEPMATPPSGTSLH